MGEEKARAEKQKESEKAAMRDRLIELIDDFIFIHDIDINHWYSEELDEKLADYLLANGVIVPPPGIGQTVYCIRYDKARKPFVKPLEIRSITTYGIGKFSVFTTRDDTWGVTAFATKEEAEKHLGKGAGNERADKKIV